MPIIVKQHIHPDITIGIWKIDEDLSWFEKRYLFNDEEKEQYEKFLVESRKKQWLSCRLIAKDLIPGSCRIGYDDNGKPHLKDQDAKLSLSHSYDLSAVIISKHKNVGIDIEKASSRLSRVKDRFLSDNELREVDTGNELKSLCTYWGAKEALYKLYGKRKLDFREHIYVNPFKMKDKGELKAVIRNESNEDSFRLFYEQIDDYVMVYATD